MEIRLEEWMGHQIRFVEVEKNEWQAIANDVCSALDLKNSRKAIASIPTHQKGVTTIYTLGGKQKVNTVSEIAIYKLIFKSRKEEAESFQEWVYETIKHLREVSKLEGFQIFRMLDKEHQKEAMNNLKNKLRAPVRVDFIKANTIANKAVSSVHGHPKMIKKDQMTPEMLVQRQDILDDAVNLMAMSDKFKLNLSVSQTIYDKYLGDVQRNRQAN